MSQYATMLLSKVIDGNDPAALARLGVTKNDMPTQAEKQAYDFIVKYAEQNRGQAPSYAAVTDAVPEFYYLPEVSDSYEYLTREVKSYSAKFHLMKLVEGGLNKKFHSERDGNKVIDYLLSELERIKIDTNIRSKVGTNVKADGEKFLAEYDRRKAGESFRLWKSNYSHIGEYISGNVYTVYGKSGRGKSVITLEEVIYAALQGANVLIWSLEMGWFEVLVRIYVSISGRRGYTTAKTHGMELAAGFESADLRKGRLPEEFEIAFRAFIENMNEIIPGNITVRAVDDSDFTDRSLRALAADIEATKADVVMIDPFYYLHYEKNTSKTTGGDASNTSMKLRQLVGQKQVVAFAITQAEEDKKSADSNEEGERELVLPERGGVKKTTQLLEDAALLVAVDTDYKQGRGLIGINKGRDGGEGDSVEILYIPSVGVVREMEVGEAAASQFDF